MNLGIIESRGPGEMPIIMYVVGLAMALVLTRDLWIFATIMADSWFDILDLEWSLRSSVLLITSALMSVFAILTMLTLPSAKARSWRSAARYVITISLLSFVQGYMGMYTTSLTPPEESLWITGICLLILFLPGVRKYYTPPMVETPNIFIWMRYIIIRPKHEDYIYMFETEEQ